MAGFPAFLNGFYATSLRETILLYPLAFCLAAFWSIAWMMLLVLLPIFSLYIYFRRETPGPGKKMLAVSVEETVGASPSALLWECVDITAYSSKYSTGKPIADAL